MKKVVLLAAFIGLVMFCSSEVSAQWRSLGFKQVDNQRDKDTFQVGESRGQFRSIQFRAIRANVRISRVVVHYGNDQRVELDAPDLIRAGARSRALDLKGERRRIHSVEIWYRSTGAGGRKAYVYLYGR